MEILKRTVGGGRAVNRYNYGTHEYMVLLSGSFGCKKGGTARVKAIVPLLGCRLFLFSRGIC